ncbi:MAG: tripartite tricarboxylate transporter TctB family protein [Rhodospirillales bacterium]|nr:tripartite tricarboxylate transporter TctB family protein [Rhodospirillales bacterium]MDH3917876.1 tripartite tricarboxylate transporter TctB family protein [Rhodospirillales bacterium]MDH3965459.1 tripartite tricarboxylate transporter TctB family protein [Rhodospirillales bacterium]
MAQESTPLESKRKRIGGDLVIPLAAVAFTIYYFSTIIDSPWTAQVSAFFVGTILIVLIGILGVRSVIALKKGEADLGMETLLASRAYLSRRLGLLALTVGFIFVVDWAGFTLTTFVFLATAMLLLSEGRNRRFILFLSAMLALAGYLLFILAFETRFPAGPFENLMKQVL